jgi:hypothetical protein
MAMTVPLNSLLRATRKEPAVVEYDGRITACATSIGFPGHAVAENNAGMKALIGAASSFGGPGFLLPPAMRNCFGGAWAKTCASCSQ